MSAGTALGASARLAVLHLVRKANGPEPLTRFLDSYRAHRAGVEHELVLLLKGFESEAESAPFMALAADVTDRSLSVVDQGFDIGSYRAAAERLAHRTLCLLNSFSVILAGDWLQSLCAAHSAPGVGLAGATGSWASPHTALRHELGLGGPYAAAMGDRNRSLERVRELAEASPSEAAPRRTAVRMLATARSMSSRAMDFPAFPNRHVRTNAVVVDREMLLRARVGALRDKLAAWRFESGRRSLTRQVEAMGLRAVLVGRDGRSFEYGEWPRSDTFWQGEQENLLIADNQTESYRSADAELRSVLSAFAWGATGAAR
ncbi:MAG: hypothetical protein M3065_01005 [Actinomycetota bacterium]|nr:hypothetical protein [Actinomycetota bacterium]